MTKVKTNAYIWSQVFNRYVCFSFRGNPIPFLTLKSYIKVMAKVKPISHIWDLEFSRHGGFFVS